MAKKFTATAKVRTENIGQIIDNLSQWGKDQRRNFERHWYDNNFFDDGYHYRFLQRSTNKIIDLSERSTIYVPKRAIPKASRQIRGVANLLVTSDPTPVIYPERVSESQYPPQRQTDPMTGQTILIPNPAIEQARQEAKRVAKGSGHWVE